MPDSLVPLARQTRRRVLAAFGSSLAGSLAHGQQPGQHYRLGWIGAAPRTETYNVAFVERLRGLGFVEGRNLTIEFRSSLGRLDTLPALAGDLARQACNVIFAPGSEPTLRAVEAVTRDTPLVIVTADYDPVATGHVRDLARPGGRITGVSMLQTELPAKRLQVLKELLPKARRIGVLADVASTGQLKVTQAAAGVLGLELVVHEFKTAPYDFAAAFETFKRGRAEGMVSLGSSFFVAGRKIIIELAMQHKLPGVFHNSVWVDIGGLMSYGPNFVATYQRAAEQVAKILNGGVAGEMPIEQPNIIEMVVNLNTARALGVTVPQALRLRADRLVE